MWRIPDPIGERRSCCVKMCRFGGDLHHRRGQAVLASTMSAGEASAWKLRTTNAAPLALAQPGSIVWKSCSRSDLVSRRKYDSRHRETRPIIAGSHARSPAGSAQPCRSISSYRNNLWKWAKGRRGHAQSGAGWPTSASPTKNIAKGRSTFSGYRCRILQLAIAEDAGLAERVVCDVPPNLQVSCHYPARIHQRIAQRLVGLPICHGKSSA